MTHTSRSSCLWALVRHPWWLLPGVLVLLLLGGPLLVGARPAHAPVDGANAAAREMMSTPEHLRQEAWWPTKPAASRDLYTGSARCAECHRAIATEQATSQMAHTLVRAGSSAVTKEHPRLEYTAGDFHYILERAGQNLRMDVAAGAEQKTAIMEWAFGSGDVGQSYTWTVHAPGGDKMMESRFNYFASLPGLAETPGRLAGPPISMEMAEGRPLEEFEARTCFACHTTAMYPGKLTDASTVVPGVGCESCHGPGAAHVRAMGARRRSGGADPPEATGELAIVNSARMSPVKAVEMCGACHSTPWDVELMGARGVQTVRFPAYRLEKSRCWGAAGDDRLKCAGCHDPHGALQRDLAAYDSDCLSCHVNGHKEGGSVAGGADADHAGKACPAATSRCASCHMPKFALPEMHAKFTDHKIRVVRAGEAFPD